ncbi:hypothetical protein [Psychrobacter maritimus]|uniref:hypothetical protein n=1 Tax=Psychrobacter maritimus TaxID=256325 RepID=UPI0039B12312
MHTKSTLSDSRKGETVLLSLYSDKVRADFPSPATDCVKNRIDLNHLPSIMNLSIRVW